MTTIFKNVLAKRKFSTVDFATLKTALMLAALDGEISPAELSSFREMAASCRGCTPKSFAKLWDDALRSAGYLLIQAKLLSRNELIKLFLAETEVMFVGELSTEVSSVRKNALEILSEMASSDGDFSEIERMAIAALTERIDNRRNEVVSALYMRSM